MIDPVAWAIGEPGAQHSPEVARVLAYAATAGGEGVIAGGDMKVRPLSVPGEAVVIGAGAMVALNRASSGRSQSYVARVVSDETVPIAATGSSGGRTDLIALVVRDTSIAGNGSKPADPAKGPYVHVVVVPGVSDSVTRLQEVAGYEFVTGVALARVKLPANTATVTASMVHDIRVIAQGRSRTKMAQATSPGDPAKPTTAQNGLTSTTFVRWPDAASFPLSIPLWATHAIIRGSVESYVVKIGSTTGRLRASFVDESTPHVSFDENWSGNPHRRSLAFGGEVPIAKKYRGTVQYLNFDGLRSQNAGYLDADAFTNSLLTITFEERPE